MSSSHKKEKSIIPVKWQIPFVLVLAVVFVLALTSTIRRVQAAKQRPQPEPANLAALAGETDTADPTGRMRVLIESMRNQREEVTAAVLLPAERLYDPFVVPEIKVSDRKSGESRTQSQAKTIVEQQRQAEEEEKERLYKERQRERFITGLVLQGTLLDGDSRLALISGNLLAEKDLIERFRIVTVGAREVLLRDEYGDVILKLKEGDKG